MHCVGSWLFPVKCFGTEGRSATKAIPPSDQEYSFMKFSGEHIVVCNILVNHHRQDLVVLDEHNANLAQPAASTFEDPAIVAMV